ncbi:MAG: histidine phosphatase family protein [Aeromicrobium sp.]
MTSTSGRLFLIRHGETDWSASGRHTSVTDLDLNEAGVAAAEGLRSRLLGTEFAQVLTSPRLRARRTATVAGFPDAQVDDDLAEWNYGEYEGVTTVEIRKTIPGWTIWTHPCPGGETAVEVSARLDRVVAKARSIDGRTAVFAHGHSLRALAVRWLGLPVTDGRLFDLDTATISMLDFERETPVVLRWNT